MRTTQLFTSIGFIASSAIATKVTLLTTPNTLNATNHVQLASYDYDSGVFQAEIFIHNDDYNKDVLLYYDNLAGESTPLTSIAAGYDSSLSNDWESWIINSSIYQQEGLTKILNVTFIDVDADKVYSQVVNREVTESGNITSTEVTPEPLIKPSGFYRDIDNWLAISANSEAYQSKQRVFDNINVEGSVKGLVIAAQSYSEPDYAYHWVRDASLTFDAIIQLYESLDSRFSKTAIFLENLIFQYANASVHEQLDKNLINGLGEPKFYLQNNTGYLGAWGRPQNDGAATRASALIKFSKAYLEKGGSKQVVFNKLWTLPIAKDLLFVANNWTVQSFDLWEEVKSDHFYTKFVQRKALLDGISFAKEVIKDSSTAKLLNNAAIQLNETLAEFIYPLRNLILTEYGLVQKNKVSYKDVSVILAINHAYNNDNVFSHTNDYVLRSVYEIATSFIPVYANLSSISHDENKLPLAPPTGRYPEDVYDGVETSEGNPWYLSCLAFAEFFYKSSTEFEKNGIIEINNVTRPFWEYYGASLFHDNKHFPSSSSTTNTNNVTIRKGSQDFEKFISSLKGWGDAFLRTVKNYADTDGRLPEEFNKYTGEPRGAKDLTWSYASILTAAYARAEAKGDRIYVKSLAQL